MMWFKKVQCGSTCLEVVRKGLVSIKWFEKVRGGSLLLNHSELVYKYLTHPCSPCEEMQYLLMELSYRQ